MQERYEIVLNKSSLLLVEDDENVRDSFSKVLQLYVQHVYTAKNGEEALRLYHKYHPNIIITDIKMPKMNGLELIKNIRKENKEIPIIVTSAYADQDFLLESIKLSLVEYVIKPIKSTLLSDLLERCALLLLEKNKTIITLDKQNAYDFDNKTIIFNNSTIALTQKEIELFEILLAHKNTLVTRQNIEDKLYIYEEAPPSALKNLVFKLRKKIGNDIITTIGKLGYMISDEKNSL